MKMKILFIGSVEFSLRALEKIVEIGGNVVGVCTLRESAFNSDFCDLSQYSLKHNISFFYVDDINSDQTINWISNINPDVIFCFGWSRLLNQKILSIPDIGVIGFHPDSDSSKSRATSTDLGPCFRAKKYCFDFLLSG